MHKSILETTKSIFLQAYGCLMESNPQTKCEMVFAFQKEFSYQPYNLKSSKNIQTIDVPGRPEKPLLVSPKLVPKRSMSTKEGRAALVHAITHIEFNAINLALDAIYRFQHMPIEYYRDWLQVAFEEAQHFQMLSERLLEYGYQYGDFDAHNGLWEMAVKTKDDIVARMALVPRVLEARGLDVTPGMIKRFQQHGDDATAEILQIIFEQEIGHVAIGTRWFNYVCEQRDLLPAQTFKGLLDTYMGAELRGPFALEARRQAGFTEEEIEVLISN